MDGPVTKKRIDGAITWYRAHKSVIKESLPISTAGITFMVGWTASIERYIESWESNQCPVFLAAAYIHRPVWLIAVALKPSSSAKKSEI